MGRRKSKAKRKRVELEADQQQEQQQQQEEKVTDDNVDQAVAQAKQNKKKNKKKKKLKKEKNNVAATSKPVAELRHATTGQGTVEAAASAAQAAEETNGESETSQVVETKPKIKVKQPPFSMRRLRKRKVVQVRVTLHRVSPRCLHVEPTETEFYMHTLKDARKFELRVPYPEQVKVDVSGTEAVFDHGVLTVTLPVVGPASQKRKQPSGENEGGARKKAKQDTPVQVGKKKKQPKKQKKLLVDAKEQLAILELVNRAEDERLEANREKSTRLLEKIDAKQKAKIETRKRRKRLEQARLEQVRRELAEKRRQERKQRKAAKQADKAAIEEASPKQQAKKKQTKQKKKKKASKARPEPAEMEMEYE